MRCELSWSLTALSNVADELQLGKPVFLDGSGGAHTDDPRIRRCGYGMAIYVEQVLVGAQGQVASPYSEINYGTVDTLFPPFLLY